INLTISLASSRPTLSIKILIGLCWVKLFSFLNIVLFFRCCCCTTNKTCAVSPDHQPQECFGLLECMHNNLQTQTQIAQAQLSLLEDMRESINVLLARQERKGADPGHALRKNFFSFSLP
uniref:Uncharacterized protein n=1 Tax=Anolis carolinensis TaxID=28377 RepID=A0A803U134_ANOCA